MLKFKILLFERLFRKYGKSHITENILNALSAKEQVDRIMNSELNNKNTPKLKRDKLLDQTFYKRKKMTNKPMKISSISLVIREMQIKLQMRSITYPLERL